MLARRARMQALQRAYEREQQLLHLEGEELLHKECIRRPGQQRQQQRSYSLWAAQFAVEQEKAELESKMQVGLEKLREQQQGVQKQVQSLWELSKQEEKLHHRQRWKQQQPAQQAPPHADARAEAPAGAPPGGLLSGIGWVAGGALLCLGIGVAVVGLKVLGGKKGCWLF